CIEPGGNTMSGPADSAAFGAASWVDTGTAAGTAAVRGPGPLPDGRGTMPPISEAGAQAAGAPGGRGCGAAGRRCGSVGGGGRWASLGVRTRFSTAKSATPSAKRTPDAIRACMSLSPSLARSISEDLGELLDTTFDVEEHEPELGVGGGEDDEQRLLPDG